MLCDLFDLWTQENNSNVQVRVLASVFSLLLGGPSLVGGYGTELPTSVAIGSDGSIGPEDSLRACGEHISQTGMTIQQLQSLVEASGMVVATVHSPWEGDPAQVAGHSLAVHHVAEDQTSCLVNDSGPRGAIERVGWFLTRKGIIPIAGFAGAKNVQFTFAQMEHWLHGYQDIFFGDTPVRLCANTLVPTTTGGMS